MKIRCTLKVEPLDVSVASSESQKITHWSLKLYTHTFVLSLFFFALLMSKKCSRLSNIFLGGQQFPSLGPSQRENPNQRAAHRKRPLHKILLAGLRTSGGNQGESKWSHDSQCVSLLLPPPPPQHGTVTTTHPLGFMIDFYLLRV